MTLLMSSPALAVRSVDAHAHLDKYDDGELDSILDEIEAANIVTVSVSADLTSYARSRTIAERCRLIVPTFGIQPWEAPRFVDHLDELASLGSASPMIGEIGLDHTFISDPASRDDQRKVFATLLDVAAEQHKVVNVHSTGAERETAAMLRARGLVRVIMHWYSGDLGTLTSLIDDGILFTIGAAVLQDPHIRDVAARIPDDQLLTETDNPGGQRWLTGLPGRPRLLHLIESEVARVRGISRRQLRSLVRANLGLLLSGDPHLEPWTDLVTALNDIADGDREPRERSADIAPQPETSKRTKESGHEDNAETRGDRDGARDCASRSASSINRARSRADRRGDTHAEEHVHGRRVGGIEVSLDGVLAHQIDVDAPSHAVVAEITTQPWRPIPGGTPTPDQ